MAEYSRWRPVASLPPRKGNRRIPVRLDTGKRPLEWRRIPRAGRDGAAPHVALAVGVL